MGAVVVPGRAQREPGIHNHEKQASRTVARTSARPGLWIPGSSLGLGMQPVARAARAVHMIAAHLSK
jgi:hypothetical protein